MFSTIQLHAAEMIEHFGFETMRRGSAKVARIAPTKRAQPRTGVPDWVTTNLG